MIRRSPNLFIDDMLDAMDKIMRYTKGLDYDDFRVDDRTIDAVLRNLEVIGEAAKNIPPGTKKENPEVPWKNMIGLRNITIHEYFGVDPTIIWEIITKNIPETAPKIKKLRQKLRE